MVGKITWGNKAKHCWVMSKTFCFQKFVDNDQQCFAFTPQANFPVKNLNFHWRWRRWDQIQAIFLIIFYFLKNPKWAILLKILWPAQINISTLQKSYPKTHLSVYEFLQFSDQNFVCFIALGSHYHHGFFSFCNV